MKPLPAVETNRHEIRIKAFGRDVFGQIILWGEASWWPKQSLMRFYRHPKGPVAKGTRYRQKVQWPFGPAWDAQVEALTQDSIRRRFLNGMFDGAETVWMQEEGEAGVRVIYEMRAVVRGAVNRFLWRLIFRRLHDKNIEAILNGLKNFFEEKRS